MRKRLLWMMAALLVTVHRPVIASRPNVLFIVCDDLNTHVGPSGYEYIDTPHLDRLAASAMTFRRAYCQYPVCAPSRASFLSGLYPETTGVLSNKVVLSDTRPGTLTLPESFRRAGYWTAAVGKVFHRAGSDPTGTAWDLVEKFENDELPMVTAARIDFEKKHGPITRAKNRRVWRNYVKTLGKQLRGQQQPGYGPSGLLDAQHKDGKNARRVAEWLATNAHGEKPFLIACGIQKPHVPFLAPDAYFDKYPAESIRYTRDPADDWNDIPKLAIVKRYEGFGFEANKENDALRREYTQAYHACVSFIDAQIGIVLEALAQSGHANDTIVVFISDHGYQLGEHFQWGKVTLFETCARVPLIIRGPGTTRAGTRSHGLVELVDLFPTLAELCGVTAPKDLQGRSFAGMLEDADRPGKEAAYTVVRRGSKLGRAVRFDRWRYAEWGDPSAAELYDLDGDPHEWVNLVTKPEHAPIVERGRRILARISRTLSE